MTNLTQKFNIIGHRGYGPTGNEGYAYPENTLKSFQHALDSGADGIELDLFLTKDGETVVIHDENLHEHVVPSQSVLAAQKPVRQRSYEELMRFDLGQGEKIPTLRDVFNLVSQYSARKIVNLEVKDVNAVDAIFDNLQKNAGVLNNHYVVISAFNWDVLRAFRRRDKNLNLVPAIKTVDLFGKDNVDENLLPLTASYQPGFEKQLIEIHNEIKVSAFDCVITSYAPQMIHFAQSLGVGVQLSTTNDRVNADETDYKLLHQLQQHAGKDVPFIVCKVDEPDAVRRKMNLKPR